MATHLLEDLSQIYLSEKDITQGTFELYETTLKQFIHYLKSKSIMYASAQDIKSYMEELKDKGYSKGWVHTQTVIIKNFYKYLSDHQVRLGLDEVYAFDVALDIKNKRYISKHHKNLLSAKDIKHILLTTKINRNYIWHYRDYAIIYLMLTTALRSVEVRRAKINDLDTLGHQNILYIQGKGLDAKDNYVKLTPGVMDAIRAYLGKRKDSNPYLFVSHSYRTETKILSRNAIVRGLKAILEACGLGHLDITPHDLRRTAATLNLARGASLDEIKRFLRHRHLSTTRMYLYMDHLEADDLENALENYILGHD